MRASLARIKAEGQTAKEIVALAKLYLDRGDGAKRASPFAAARYLAVADALGHAAEHQQHIDQRTGPEPPSSVEIRRHLDRVYFRLQQVDFFVKQSADANAQRIAAFARQYYQRALRASDGDDSRSADECAKTVDELMRALENLAQSTAATAGPDPRKL